MSSRKQPNRISLKASRGIFLLSLVSVLLLTPSLADAATLSKPQNNLGLVGYWMFEDGGGTTATDYSGNGSHAELQGTSAFSTFAPPGRRGSVEIPAASDEIHIDGLSITDDITISFWVYRPDNAPPGYWQRYMRIMTGYDASDNIAFEFTSGSAFGGGIQLEVLGSTGRAYAENANNDPTKRPMRNGRWHHVVATFDGPVFQSTSVSLYVNANDELRYRTHDAGSWDRIVSKIVIGNTRQLNGVSSNNNYALQGNIADLRIYNRALSASEIQNLYEAGRATIGGGYERAYSDGLVGYWSFDGNDVDFSSSTAYDRSPYSNHGTMSNMSQATAQKAGILGQALEFDGVDDYVDAGLDTALSPPNGVSVVAWIKTTQSGEGIIGGKQRSWTGYQLYIDSNKPRFSVSSDGGSTQVVGETVISDGEWHHLVGTWSAEDDSLKLYVDGVFEKSGTKVKSVSTHRFTIGRDVANRFHFEGLIDELRVYNRPLTESEVKGLYNLGQVKIGGSASGKVSDGLIAHWDFNGKNMDWANGIITDASGNGFDGGMVNFPSHPVAPGVSGQALRFDGNNDRVLTLADLSGRSEASVSLWVRRDPNNISGNQAIISQYGTSNDRSWMIWFTNSDLRLSLQGTSALTINDTLTEGWHHVAMTFDGAVIKLYHNGVQRGSQTRTTPLVNASPIQIGRRASQEYYFAGVLDEIRVYERALSAQEVQQLYNMRR